ncbi:hypothetical protein SAMN02800692_2011 [Luteibacter sp. UNC138MFCol5.1]|nr:hypothetical protein [Luteibacter sp. UNC138MFCol5.1]SEO76652.1 hypothetical protein SAMN02800692_2011 [Luteibacter sp. UNC138MFCol5.1]
MIRFLMLAVGVFLNWFGSTSADRVAAAVYIVGFFLLNEMRRRNG